MTELTKIIVSGFGCSGSSVVVDWAREFEGCHVFEDEFDLFRFPDGVQDLRRAMTSNLSASHRLIAIERFRRLLQVMARPADGQFGRDYENKSYPGFERDIRAFVDDLIDVTYPGGATTAWFERHYEVTPFGNLIDEASVSPRALRRLGKLQRRASSASPLKRNVARAVLRVVGYPRPKAYTYREVPKSISSEAFDARARTCFDHMAANIGPFDKTHLVLDQAFSLTGLPDGLKLMSNARAVFIHRDPRDVFISGLKPGRDWLPTNSAEAFALWFRNALSVEVNHDPRVIFVAFEDFVTDREQTRRRLAEHFSLDPANHATPNTYFDPDMSRANVGRWQDHPDQTLMANVARLCQPTYEAVRALGRKN